jgi:DNA-binding transcriptional ArsR family regulator
MSSAARLDATFAALAHPARREILARLHRGEASVNELAERFDVSLPAVSRHLKVLEGAGLVARKRMGRTHRLSLVPRPLDEAGRWIARHARFWDETLDALGAYVAGLPRRGRDG